MDAEVSVRPREGKVKGNTAAKFTHMVLVSGFPIWIIWFGRNFTFHSLKAFLRHFYPPPKGHFQLFRFI